MSTVVILIQFAYTVLTLATLRIRAIRLAFLRVAQAAISLPPRRGRTFDQQQARHPKAFCQYLCELRWSVENVRELRSPPKEGLAGRSEVALTNLPEAL